MIARVINQEKTRWLIIDDAFDSKKTIELMAALIKNAGKKVHFYFGQAAGAPHQGHGGVGG